MEIPILDEKRLSLLALALAIIGLLGLYFWPQTVAYEPTAPALVAIAEDGAKVEVSGIANSVTDKGTSTSIKLCDEKEECVSVSISKAAAVDYAVMKGDSIIIDGVASSYQYAKFIRADKIRHAR